MSHIQGDDRKQIILFPESIDDYVGEDNMVRFIDAFVDDLDFEQLGFVHASAAATGRPPYHPADLLKLYIYGYLNRIRSSRRLEAESRRNLELMWLLRRLTPDFKTIADFRKNNLKAIRATVAQFTALCRKVDLIGGELIAIDGSKLRAQNSKKNNFTKAKLKKAIRRIKEQVGGYLDELAKNDQSEEAKPEPEGVKEKIAALKERRDRYQDLLTAMEVAGKSEVSLIDPDARLMKTKQGVQVCYNAQTVVDEKHKLIIDYELTSTADDSGLLAPMALRAKEVLGAEELEVLSDKGYYNGPQMKDCLEEGITPLIPRPREKGAKPGLYPKELFVYDHENDCYICPAGQKLGFAHNTTSHGKKCRRYRTGACSSCTQKDLCTKSNRGRTITRWEHEAILEQLNQMVKQNPEKMKLRQQLAEHPFGTIKRGFDQGYLLLKGLGKVNTEFGLSVLAYNIKRAINIKGVEGLMAAARPG